MPEIIADPKFHGRVAVGWSIVSGKVQDARLVDNTTGSAAFGECMVRVVRSLRFAPSLTTEVSEYPWVVGGV